MTEFEAICRKQELPAELCGRLKRAIFFQRPLKSQKGLVGKCSFEKSKNRCPVSHPLFEEFRMLCFLNNVRIKRRGDAEYRAFTEDEIALAKGKFFRKSKPQFDFEDIAKEIAGRKGSYGFREEGDVRDCLFNFRMKTNVSGCPVTAGLMELFGDDWLRAMCSVYRKAAGKTEFEILNDVWHALYSFDDESLLQEWGIVNLQLTEEQGLRFSKIKIVRSYASLSLKAISKMLPYLRIGLRYDEAAFCANLSKVVPADIWADEIYKNQIVGNVVETLRDFKNNPMNRSKTKKDCVLACLQDIAGGVAFRPDRLYHPSMIETYQAASPNRYGVVLLGSPRTSSVRNPMAMRHCFACGCW